MGSGAHVDALLAYIARLERIEVMARELHDHLFDDDDERDSTEVATALRAALDSQP
jgi:hypothetical protein